MKIVAVDVDVSKKVIITGSQTYELHNALYCKLKMQTNRNNNIIKLIQTSLLMNYLLF